MPKIEANITSWTPADFQIEIDCVRLNSFLALVKEEKATICNIELKYWENKYDTLVFLADKRTAVLLMDIIGQSHPDEFDYVDFGNNQMICRLWWD